MRSTNRTSLGLGMVAGAALASLGAILMGQGVADQPANTTNTYQPSNTGDSRTRMGAEYFVTGDGNKAHLWTRDGSSLRWVSSADATNRTMPNDRPIDRTKPDSKNPSTTNPSNPNNPDPSNPNPK